MLQNPKQFVEDAELAIPPHEIVRLNKLRLLQRALQNAHEGEPESYVNLKSVISIAASVKTQHREDLLNSLLLAQLVASKKHPDEAQTMEWYATYTEVLINIGWNVQSRQFSDFTTSKSIFEMDNAILDILGAAVGGSYMAVIVKTLEAFKKLSDSDNKIIAFEKNTHSLKKGSFQVGMATAEDDALAVNMGAFVLSSTNEIKNILFFKSGKDQFELKVSLIEMTLNESIYRTVRTDIANKLTSHISRYVAELEL